jgi:hypothetical protein
VHPVAFRYATSLMMRMRIRIRIWLNVLGGASVGRVVIPRGAAGAARIDGAVPSASSMMLRVVVVMMRMVVGASCLVLLCAPSDSSAVAEVAVAVADEAPTPALKMGNVSPANPLSTGCKIDKSWNSSARS